MTAWTSLIRNLIVVNREEEHTAYLCRRTIVVHYADWCGKGRFVGEGRRTPEDSTDVLRSKFNFELYSGRAEEGGFEFVEIRNDRIGSQSRRTEGAQGPVNLQRPAF